MPTIVPRTLGFFYSLVRAHEPRGVRTKQPATENVSVALMLLVIVLLHAVWDMVSNREVIASAPMQDFAAWFWWAFAVFGVLFPVLFGIAIVARRRWARAALAVYFVVEWLVIVIGSAIAGQAESLFDTKLLLGLGVEIAILALLFSAPTSQWFRAGSPKAA